MSGTYLSKIPVLVVALVIGIVLVTSAVVPLASDYSDAKTFTNEGYFYMQKITADDEGTYTFDYQYDADTTTLSFKFNDVAIDTTGWPSNLPVTVATDSDNWVVRMGYYSEYIGLQGMGYGFAFGGHGTKSVSITFSQGTATATAINTADSTGTYSTTYTEMWIYSPVPTDYVMKKADKMAYMLDDSEFYAIGITAVTTWNTAISITGTVEDFDGSIIYPPNLTTTITNKEIIKTEVDSYVDLNQLDKLTFTINDGTTTVNATYSYFIVPSEVTADPDNPAAYKNLVKVVPLMAFIMLVVAAAGMVYLKNKD